MFFQLAKNSPWLQKLIIKILALFHPSIEHNLAKIEMLKKAFFYCELERIEGSYFEFGVYEGTSLYAAVENHRRLKSSLPRNFYGFDSFEEGFKYFDEKDRHPFFKEGEFKSSYIKILKRFRKFKNVSLVKGYFEEVIAGKDIRQMYPGEKCAIVFLDCDLMNPALIALQFIAPILQRGSVIILDDYWAYRGDPNRGTAGALAEFFKRHPKIKVREFFDYGHGGKSFIVSHH